MLLQLILLSSVASLEVGSLIPLAPDHAELLKLPDAKNTTVSAVVDPVPVSITEDVESMDDSVSAAADSVSNEFEFDPMDVELSEMGEYAGADEVGNGDTINDYLNEIKDSITKEMGAATKTGASRCSSDTNVKTVAQEKDFGDKTKYFNLVGCAAKSECETSTEKQQNIAIAAHKRLGVLQAEIAKMRLDLKTGDGNKKTNSAAKKALEEKKKDNNGLHIARMKKFTDAIAILKRINAALDNSGKITAPKLVQVSKEEKNVLGNFKVGKAMLLMLDQALTGVKEKELVQSLKKLLASCISSLEGSKTRELKKHNDWVVFMDAKIKAKTDEISRLTGVMANLAKDIAAHDKLITAEELKKKNALKTSDAERNACLSEHTDFVSDMANFQSELAAIAKMIEILKEAGLGAETAAIRDETDKTKHGVKESLGGACWSSKLEGNYIREGHGKTNECYPLEEAKAKCEAAADCKAIATQSNVCRGLYRVTHGGPSLVYYANWRPYNLWAYKIIKC